MHFLLFILNYGNTHICHEPQETKIEKTSLQLEKKNVKCSKYNIIEYKKCNLILILHMWFHFTVKCQQFIQNNEFKLCISKTWAQIISALFLEGTVGMFFKLSKIMQE